MGTTLRTGLHGDRLSLRSLNLLFLQIVQAASGAHPALYSLGTEGEEFVPDGKAVRHKPNHIF
jgi:hypothetical protein